MNTVVSCNKNLLLMYGVFAVSKFSQLTKMVARGSQREREANYQKMEIAESELSDCAACVVRCGQTHISHRRP